MQFWMLSRLILWQIILDSVFVYWTKGAWIVIRVELEWNVKLFCLVQRYIEILITGEKEIKILEFVGFMMIGF